MTQTKNIASKLTDTKKNIKFYWYLFKTFLDDKKTCFMKMNLSKKLLRFVKEMADFFQFILSYAMFPNCKQSIVQSIFLTLMKKNCQINLFQKCCYQDNAKLGIR